MSAFRHLRNERGNWTLIGLLLAVAIVVVLAALMFGGGGNGKLSPEGRLKQANQESGLNVKPKEGQSVVGASMDVAKDTQCQSNLRQIRMSIQMSQQQDGAFPPAIDAKQVGSVQVMSCPVSGQQYTYNPSNGTVKCTTKGHEGY